LEEKIIGPTMDKENINSGVDLFEFHEKLKKIRGY